MLSNVPAHPQSAWCSRSCGAWRDGRQGVEVRQRPIRLARQPVVSLADVSETPTSTTMSAGLGIDWPAVLAAARFDGDETTLIIAHRLQGVTRGELPERLGWPARIVERVRRRISRKFRMLQSIRVISPRVLTRAAKLGNKPASDPSSSLRLVMYGDGFTWEFRDRP